jgi:putative endonuclease
MDVKSLGRKLRVSLSALKRRAAPHLAAGRRGEEFACAHLRKEGYTILARNLRLGRGEVDILAEEGEFLVFVEVKTRRKAGEYGALLNVTRGKRRQIAALAERWRAENPSMRERPVRFDVVAVEGLDEAEPQITLIRHAFDAWR